jgi:DNA repair/transcription protein MET18/MMS19
MTIVHQLTTYFCERLENRDNINSFRAGVKECAKILSTFAQMENQRFPPRDARLVALSVFAFNRGSNLRDQKAATRLSLLELINTLMRLYTPNLVADIGPREFVEGVVAMAEFEKDPTCLNVLFPIYVTLSAEWGLNDSTLVLIWDSFIRYYPITIGGRATSVPSPNELKQLLLDCFISNNSYARVAFPRLIELLDTSQDLSTNVKVRLLRHAVHMLNPDRWTFSSQCLTVLKDTRPLKLFAVPLDSGIR